MGKEYDIDISMIDFEGNQRRCREMRKNNVEIN